MSSSVRDDGDRPIKRSPQWPSERQELERARHLVDEVAAVAAEIQREAQRSRRARAGQWREDDEDRSRAPEERYSPEPSRGLWSPTLEPVVMPPPPKEKGGMPGLKMAAGFIGAVVVAAGVAFVLMRAVQGPTTGMVASADGGSRQSQSFSAPVLENLTQISTAEAKAPTEPSPRPVGTLLANSQANAVAVTTPLPAAPLASRPLADVPQTARTVEPPRNDQQARLDPPAPPVAEPPVAAPRAIEALSREEVLSLRKRGQDLLSVGDIASARLILTRLGEAGDADATLMLAGTYDATVLAGLHVVGIRPDPAKAHEWYMRAAELGSSEARLRLQQSARR
jgi:hypothetical protein